jgi:dGTPase
LDTALTHNAQQGDPRKARRYVETVASQHLGAESESRRENLDEQFHPKAREIMDYRVDLERLRFSPYFGRLAAVTQVIPQNGVGPIMHNRLTHSLKVSAVARVIAAQLAAQVAQHEAYAEGTSDRDSETGRIIAGLGGCDTIVSQASAHAHDLGHPPFGHLGERVLDTLARTRLGLPEGFEGNAQTFRILTNLDTLGRQFGGLNLTAAVRASVLKYPWARADWSPERVSALALHERPRGVGRAIHGADKFSFYGLEAAEAREVLAAYPGVAAGQQTVDCAIMDIADDIAYAVHDLDDFMRAGVLQYAPVSAELRGWLAGAHEYEEAAETPDSQHDLAGVPGAALESLWQSLARKDRWIADRDAFYAAVSRVNSEFVEQLLARPYDGGIEAERAVSTFTREWIEHLRASVVVSEHPAVRGGYVQLSRQAWHEVAVLKFVHSHFVLQGPELVVEQRGMAHTLSELVLAFDEWMSDPVDAARAPRRLREGIEQVTQALAELEDFGKKMSSQELKRAGRSRAIIDHIASLTDQQAIVTHRQLTSAR